MQPYRKRRFRVLCVDPNDGHEEIKTYTAFDANEALARAQSNGWITGWVRPEDAEEACEPERDLEDSAKFNHRTALALCSSALACGAVTILVLCVSPPRTPPRHARDTTATDASIQVAQPAATTLEAAEPEPPLLETPTANSPSIRLEGSFVVIPLHGEIGSMVRAEGIESCLLLADSIGVEQIVLDIDSTGGDVATAIHIAHLLHDLPPHYKTIALVSQAFSAAAMIALTCDLVILHPDCAIGAAVSFSGSISSGSAEVDAKLNAAFASQFAALAEAHGHCGAIVWAMCVMDKELWQITDQHTGTWYLTNQSPNNNNLASASLLDSSSTVLSLTAREASALGVGPLAESDDIELAPSWEEAVPGRCREIMATAMQMYALQLRDIEARRAIEAANRRDEERRAIDEVRRAREAVERLQRDEEARDREAQARRAREAQIERDTREIRALADRLTNYVRDAERKAPSAFDDYYYHTVSGVLTMESQYKWRQRTDEAISAWNTVRAGIRDIAERMQARDLAGIMRPVVQELETMYERAGLEIAFLRNNRERRH